MPDLEASKTSHASSADSDAALVSDIKDLIKTYYKAEDDHKLGRLRGKLLKSARARIAAPRVMRTEGTIQSTRPDSAGLV